RRRRRSDAEADDRPGSHNGGGRAAEEPRSRCGSGGQRAGVCVVVAPLDHGPAGGEDPADIAGTAAGNRPDTPIRGGIAGPINFMGCHSVACSGRLLVIIFTSCRYRAAPLRYSAFLSTPWLPRPPFGPAKSRTSSSVKSNSPNCRL